MAATVTTEIDTRLQGTPLMRGTDTLHKTEIDTQETETIHGHPRETNIDDHEHLHTKGETTTDKIINDHTLQDTKTEITTTKGHTHQHLTRDHNHQDHPTGHSHQDQ